jgi:hypothetical protein
LYLAGMVSPGFLIKKRQVLATAFCHKSDQVVDNPYVGCDVCHPLTIKISVSE